MEDILLTDKKFTDTVDVSVDSIFLSLQPSTLVYEVMRDGKAVSNHLTLEKGSNNYSVIVENNERFNVSIFRMKSNESHLKDLTITPALESWNGLTTSLEYNLTVPREQSYVSITAIGPENSSKVSIFKNDIPSSNPLKLEVGNHKVLVRSWAEDEEHFTDYSFSFYRQPLQIADMYELNLSIGNLVPTFDPEIYDYTLSLSNNEQNLRVEGIADSLASINYFYNGATTLGEFHVVGDQSLFEARVLADDKVKTKKYTVRIFRNPWNFRGNGPFKARDGAGILDFNDKLWLLGGWETQGTLNDIWSSDDGVNWQFESIAPWSARHCAGTVVFNNKMWILSGDGLTDVWSSMDGLHWIKELDDAPWGKRYAPYVVVHDGKIWLMGGESFYETPTHGINDVWSSVDGVNWEKVLDNAPWTPRGLIHGKAVFNNKIWVVGGGLKGLNEPAEYGDVWNTSDGVHWNNVTGFVPWQARYHFSVAVYNEKIWITDGSIGAQENLSNEVWSSSDGIIWQKMRDIPWAPTHATSLIPFKNSLFMVGGYLRNEIWEMNLN